MTGDAIDLTVVADGEWTFLGEVQFFSERPAGSVPEPASWATMLLGFGALGVVIRRRRTAGATATA